MAVIVPVGFGTAYRKLRELVAHLKANEKFHPSPQCQTARRDRIDKAANARLRFAWLAHSNNSLSLKKDSSGVIETSTAILDKFAMRNAHDLRNNSSRREKWLRWLFRIGVVLKGVDGLLETVGGVLFLIVTRSTLTRLVFQLTRPEILEDPDDLVANALRHAFSHLSASGKLFGSIYLLVHGAIKIFLVIYLLRDRLWAFPTAIVALIAFIGYQLYHLSVHFSWTLTALTVLDVVIILLIWHEWNYLKRQRRKSN